MVDVPLLTLDYEMCYETTILERMEMKHLYPSSILRSNMFS